MNGYHLLSLFSQPFSHLFSYGLRHSLFCNVLAVLREAQDRLKSRLRTEEEMQEQEVRARITKDTFLTILVTLMI
jgi:hypothetical protein